MIGNNENCDYKEEWWKGDLRGMGLREKACVPWGMEEKEINDNGEEKLKCGTGSHSCRKSLG